MKDYNLPPTEEFARLTESGPRYPHHWLTMMKCVLNDYWFDCPKDDVPWRNEEFIDHFMHKMYYCWLMQLREVYGGEEE